MLGHMQVCTSSQITTPTSHHSAFYRPDALPAAQPTVSKQPTLKLYLIWFDPWSRINCININVWCGCKTPMPVMLLKEIHNHICLIQQVFYATNNIYTTATTTTIEWKHCTEKTANSLQLVTSVMRVWCNFTLHSSQIFAINNLNSTHIATNLSIYCVSICRLLFPLLHPRQSAENILKKLNAM